MFLKDNPALMAEVEAKVKGLLGITSDQQGAGEAEAAEE